MRTFPSESAHPEYDAFAEGRDLWGPATAEYFAPLDVAGYNYKAARYEYDGEKFPDRVTYGSETYPRAALQNWQATVRNPHVIGDFVWTAWDYIGEVGVGRWEVSDQSRPGDAGYPWLLAHCGDIDILGQKRPQSWYRDVVWGLAKAPRMFCLPPELVGKNIARLSWGWLPVRRSYSFTGYEGQTVEVHIYADADEVELFQNGESMGKLPCGEEQEYQAVFSVSYRPGTLEAVARRGGAETGRDMLRTAGATAKLALHADKVVPPDGGEELCFLTIQAVDQEGIPVFDETGEVNVKVSRGGRLLALGAADPKPDRRLLYCGDACPMFEGTVMAVIKGDPGAEDCTVDVALGSRVQAHLTIEFAPMVLAPAPVHDVLPGPLHLPLGELMAQPGVMEVLRTFLPAIVDNPMAAAMAGMSLKKIFSMSGQAAPEGLEDALTKVLK